MSNILEVELEKQFEESPDCCYGYITSKDFCQKIFGRRWQICQIQLLEMRNEEKSLKEIFEFIANNIGVEHFKISVQEKETDEEIIISDDIGRVRIR